MSDDFLCVLNIDIDNETKKMIQAEVKKKNIKKNDLQADHDEAYEIAVSTNALDRTN